MPPRHGKTMLASENFPSWYLGRNPQHYVIAASHTQELADEIGRKVRNQIAGEAFKAIFRNVGLRQDSTSARRFHTTHDGTYFAAGIGGPITGRGAHLLLIDDPIKGRDKAESRIERNKVWDWYTSTAYTRLMPGGAVVVIQTRWHPDDLAGRLLRDHADEGWTVVEMPALGEAGAALWPEQYSAERLQEIRKRIGERDWAALYQQQPVAREGGTFRWSDIEPAIGRVRWTPSLNGDGAGKTICTGVDLATRKGEGNDLTAFATVERDGPRFKLLHLHSGRMEAGEILRTMLDIYRRFHSHVARAHFRVEDNAAQAYIVQMARDARQMQALGATEGELSRLHVRGHTTTAVKRHIELGVPGLAADLEMGRWDFPEHREMRALAEEMLCWSPDVHTGDRLMALWIAREGLRQSSGSARFF